MMELFHFIRPAWFFALLPLLLLVALLLKRHLANHNWQSEVDPALLPHLLIKQSAKTNYFSILAFFSAGVLAIAAMAGPSWERLPQPVFKKQAALIIAIHLSRSMDAVDLKPSRLARVKFKVSDILKQRREGQTGLIVYAEEAYTVSPITEDAATIEALLPALSTDIMPAAGNNTGIALHKAAELITNAGFNKGDILLVSDQLHATTENSLNELAERGFRVSMLAVGTSDGGPIPLESGGFLKDADDQIVVPKLNSPQLRSTIEKAGGLFSEMSLDDSDTKTLTPIIAINTLEGESLETDIETDIWREFGPWLLVVLLPLAALAFRRGYLMIGFLLILPVPPPANALSLDELFSSDNERAMALFNDGQFNEAGELFDDKEWQAAAWYRARQYELAIRILENIDTAEAHYNRGNALAQQGEIGNAINAYDQAIQLDPEHEDAIYNKALLEKLENEQDEENQESQNPEQQEQDEEKESEAAAGGDASEMTPEPGEEDTEASEAAESAAQSEAEDSEAENEQQQNKSNKTEQTTEQDETPDKESKDNKKNEPGSEPQQQANQQPDEDAAATEENNIETDLDELQPLSDKTVEQWLDKVEEDPGGLLRRKFKFLYQKQHENKNNINE